MSYDIYIGEAAIRGRGDDYGEELRVIVESLEHADAPQFPNDRLTGQGNHRHPAYVGWSEFTKAAGLYRLFFDDDDGLMSRHPGCFALNPEHHRLVKDALDTWCTAHPDAIPGFVNWDPRTDVTTDAHLDPILARLIWLEWWIGWSLANCQRPAIYNF